MQKFKVAGLVSVIAILAAMPAVAQTASSNSNSTSGSTSASGSSSRATATGGTSSGNTATQNQNQGVTANTNTGVTLNQNSTTPASTSANNTTRDVVSGGTNNSNVQSGYTSSDNIVRTTPTVYAPPVSGGNPCTLAVSGGVSVIGWGAAAGGTFVDQDCANRQKIAMIWNAGFKGPAKELMCNDKDSYYAFRAAGEPCQIRPAWETPGVAPQPMVQQAPPTPIGPTVQNTTTGPAFQPSGRFACMDARGREVKPGTPGASCGYI